MLTKFKQIKNHSGAMLYLKNTSWLFAEKILRLTLGLFIGIWVARYLGPEEFGLYSYAVSFVGIFIAISTLGLDGIVVRELVKGRSKSNTLIGTAFYLKVVGALLVLCFLAISVGFASHDEDVNLYIFIIASSTIFQSFNVIDFYFQSKVLSKYVVYSNIFMLVISSIVKVFLVLNEASLIAFVYVVLLDSFMLSLGLIFFYLKNKSTMLNWAFDWNLAVSLLKDSWLLILSGVVSSIYMQIDQVMIQHMLGSREVGEYAAAVRLSEVWYFFPVIISSSLFPAIINAKNKGDELYYERLQKLYDFMVWLAIAIALIMTFVSEWVIILLYGIEYKSAGQILMIHIWAAVFIFLGVASSKWYIIENLQKHAFYKALSGAVINVGLNWTLIPMYGIYGSAMATIASLIAADYIYNAFFKKTRITFLLQTNSFFLPFRWLIIKLKRSRNMLGL